MLAPRMHLTWPMRPNMKFIGGNADFDLWYRDDQSAVMIPSGDILPYLRVVRLAAPGTYFTGKDWDEFRLPLDRNEKLGSSLTPKERKLKGRWGDVYLTRDEVSEIETYLRCFAPWALAPAEQDNKKETDHAPT